MTKKSMQGLSIAILTEPNLLCPGLAWKVDPDDKPCRVRPGRLGLVRLAIKLPCWVWLGLFGNKKF